ncbi:arsenic efflux protein [Hornefia butyriciproducens]|uniref:arsenic efflux protein n=1 Tax=Hornefia butyriciproducens TaxID=2652293 RepID=UPI002A758185|nr:arsenic efflux protein [Hornefia butyriciproducens]MDY2991859.1 arsenic efflux protein [Hornefia butyriciproducens]
MKEAIIEAAVDSVKLVPFLFVTYLVMGALERAAGRHARAVIQEAGKVGPIWGGLLGAIPQCGFSAAATYFYVGKVVTLGTLISIYLSTSDEMLPIFISEKVPVGTIVSIMAAKVIIGVISGYAVEFFFGWLARRRRIPKGYDGESGPGCGCGCGTGLFIESVQKTLQVFVFILLVSIVIGCAIEAVGHQAISGLFQDLPVAGELIAALVGLIPNCAASVVITQMYLEGVIGAGPMMSGLLCSAGVGLLVLIRENHHWKQDGMVIGILYMVSVFWGVVIEALGISF